MAAGLAILASATFAGAICIAAGFWLARSLYRAEFEDAVQEQLVEELVRVREELERQTGPLLEDMAERRRRRRDQSSLN